MAIDFTKSYPVIEWDLNNYHFFTKYFGKKEENAKGFKIQIMQDGEVLTPTTETLRIYCKKKDGTSVYIDSSTVIDTYYIINLTNQVYSVVGLVECELQLNSNNKWLYSPTFGINVDDNLMDGSIVSSNDFIALQNALNQVDNLESTYAPRLTNVETSKIDKASIVNNTITTAEGTVLDGRMGKNLQDQVTTINNNLGDLKTPVLRQKLKYGTPLTFNATSGISIYLILTHQGGALTNMRSANLVFCAYEGSSGTVAPILAGTDISVTVSGMTITVEKNATAGSATVTLIQLS